MRSSIRDSMYRDSGIKEISHCNVFLKDLAHESLVCYLSIIWSNGNHPARFVYVSDAESIRYARDVDFVLRRCRIGSTLGIWKNP